jgi:hypothetical protein
MPAKVGLEMAWADRVCWVGLEDGPACVLCELGETTAEAEWLVKWNERLNLVEVLTVAKLAGVLGSGWPSRGSDRASISETNAVD